MEKYFGADGIILIEGQTYAIYKKNGPKSRKYPYLVNTYTGECPTRKQLPLVKNYLLQIGVEVPDNWNTHQVIRKAIQHCATMNFKAGDAFNEL